MVEVAMIKMETQGSKKLVSLILTTYNCKDVLLQTLRSIEHQTYSNMELIIIDGKSTDGTTEEIIAYNQHAKYPVKWISEQDQGIYDAINKGIRLASGDYIAIMNDQYTVLDAIQQLVDAAESKEEYVGSHGDLVYAEEGKVIRTWKMGQGRIETGWMPGHPTLMLRASVYKEYGLYDSSYTCSADYEFMLRFLKDGKQLAYVPENLVSMYYGGTSTASLASYIVSFREAYRALKQNKIPCAFLICIMRTVRVLLQFVKK